MYRPCKALLSVDTTYYLSYVSFLYSFFFFNDTPTPEIYTLSLHDALPIFVRRVPRTAQVGAPGRAREARPGRGDRDVLADRKSTRLNSSHRCISYAVFCLKKKK